MTRIVLLTTMVLAWMAADRTASSAIDCKRGACRGETIACKDGADCEVRCEGADACRGARFVGPRDRKLVVVCRGAAACAGASFSGSKSLDVRCDGKEACRDTELTCGDATCDWLCVDDDACPGLVVR